MTEQLRKSFKVLLLNKDKQNVHYDSFTTFVIKNLEAFFQTKITPNENATFEHYLFNFAGGERTYIREDLSHYEKIETLVERTKIGDMLFFQTNALANIGFYIGNFKMLYFNNHSKKVCTTNLYKNTKLTKSLVGIKNIESFYNLAQTLENTK